MEHDTHPAVRNKTFISVWAVLVTLTLASVGASLVHAGTASLLVPLLIATAKASLVLWFFMHLKYERALFKVMLLFPLATLAVIMGLTFMDTLFR